MNRVNEINANVHAKNEPWAQTHTRSWALRPVSHMITSLAQYADKHEQRFESLLANDYVLGLAWREMLDNCRTLLNGELDGLDGGTCDEMLCAIARLAGFNDTEVS